DPDTSQITISLVFFCLRRLNESSISSPPVLKDWRNARRRSTLEPRLTGSHRRLGLRSSLLAILRANREISSSSSVPNKLKSFSAEDSTLLAAGKLICSVPPHSPAPPGSRKKTNPPPSRPRGVSRACRASVEWFSHSTIFLG